MSTHLANPRDQASQTMAEYAAVLAVVTIAVVVTLGLLSSSICKAKKEPSMRAAP
jgi:Flp pilus assembly pilin Flp